MIALLCCTLCAPVSMGLAAPAPVNRSARPAARPARPPYRSSQLQGNRRILQALDRFTFGPRPGDVEAVRAMGLEKWFDQQLNPDSIDETALNAHLAQFPAMQWSVQELFTRFPSKILTREAIRGQVPIPEEPVEHAIYENQIYRIEAQQQNKANGIRKQNRPSPNAAMNGMSVSPADQGAQPSAQMAEPGAMDAAAGGNTQASAGQTPNDDSTVRDLASLAPDERVEHLASIREPEFDEFMKTLRAPQRARLMAGLSPAQKETVGALESPERVVSEELLSERLMCDTYSNAQLLEVMTDFWLNHFNIYLRKDQQMPYYLVSYERDTIRPHALGKFEDLLEAVAHSPAMLLYLDNASSVGPDSIAARRFKRALARRPGRKHTDLPGINENYGRELMELHTVGVNGGYTQADVIQAARVLTGWGIGRPDYGVGFVFKQSRHEPGTKTVLGVKIKQNGEMEGEELLHLLATRPATAQFLSRELAQRFVSDNPPQALVNRMAKTYLATGGDISAVLKTLIHSPEFWASSDYHAKVKTPIEYVVSALRASNANVQNYAPLITQLRAMGMPVFGCVPPNGYSWDASAWVNTGALVDRMNFALALASNRLPGIRIDWATETDADAAANAGAETPVPSAAREEARLVALLLPGGASASTRSAALDEFQRQTAQNVPGVRKVSDARPGNRQFGRQYGRQVRRRFAPTPLERENQLLAGLLIGSPDFQRR
ncbi:MAG: DUF1800 domain-containing protein [Terracidiphilus sp.]